MAVNYKGVSTDASKLTGILDGDRLPAPTTDKKGGVPATGTPSGKYLKDDGTWAEAGAGTPSDSVAYETSFGGSPNAGASTNYSRGDHTHGTPTDPVTAHQAVTASVHNFDASGNAPAQSHDNTRHSVAYALGSDLTTHTGLTTTAHGGLLPSTAFSGVAKITVGTTEPSTPSAGDLWVDTN
jgi:hypothetical protein